MLKFHLVSDLPLKLHVYKVRGVVARAVDAENHDCHDAEIEQRAGRLPDRSGFRMLKKQQKISK